MSLEKPRCSSCKNFKESLGRCELAPKVFVKFGAKEEDDRVVTAWRQVQADEGCNEHTDFLLWAMQPSDKAIHVGVEEDVNNIRGPYNCRCVQMNKAMDRYRTTIVYNNRNLSCDNNCRFCDGSGKAKEGMVENLDSAVRFDPRRNEWVEDDGARLIPQGV